MVRKIKLNKFAKGEFNKLSSFDRDKIIDVINNYNQQYSNFDNIEWTKGELIRYVCNENDFYRATPVDINEIKELKRLHKLIIDNRNDNKFGVGMVYRRDDAINYVLESDKEIFNLYKLEDLYAINCYNYNGNNDDFMNNYICFYFMINDNENSLKFDYQFKLTHDGKIEACGTPIYKLFEDVLKAIDIEIEE